MRSTESPSGKRSSKFAPSAYFRSTLSFYCPTICTPYGTLPPEDHRYPLRWPQIKSRFTQEFLNRGGVEQRISVSRALNGERGILQRRYFEHTVRDEKDLKRCVDYVHINPLKPGLVALVIDWPWSTFHRYVALGEYSPDWGSDPTFYGDEWLQYE